MLATMRQNVANVHRILEKLTAWRDLTALERSVLWGYRQELFNAYLIAKVGFDAAENEFVRSPYTDYFRPKKGNSFRAARFPFETLSGFGEFSFGPDMFFFVWGLFGPVLFRF